MLYVSTRDRTSSFTAYRALHNEYAPDGGLFAPFKLPIFTAEEIRSFQTKSFGQTVSEILNLFFNTKLTEWDVEFAIGRNPVRVVMMNHRLILGELWHNTGFDYAYAERILFNKVCGSTDKEPTEWSKIAIRIAFLFAVYGELSRIEVEMTDIAVPSVDFTIPIAPWYARKMGIPIGTILCGCEENGGFWDLLNHGEFSCSMNQMDALSTNCNLLPIERLLYETFGYYESVRFADVCARNGIYTLHEDAAFRLKDGFYASVVSERRTLSVISGIHRSNKYWMDKHTAVAYSCLQDYRATVGDSRVTLLLADTRSNH